MTVFARRLSLLLQLFLLVALAPNETRPQNRRTAIASGEPYLIVRKGRFGFVDGRGRVVIKPQYPLAAPFSEGLAAVIIRGKRNKDLLAFIDRKGRLAVRPFDGSATRFSSGVANVLMGANYIYIDKRGRWVSRFYQNAEDCTEGLCAVRMDPLGPKMWGYINTSGIVIVKGQYDWAEPFKEGIGRVGIMIGEPYLKNGAPALDGKEGYIDRTGKQITLLEFDKAWDFSNGMGQVQLKGKWGYIDKTGRLAISPRFDETRAFKEDLAGVKMNGLWGFIGKTGEMVIAPQFEFVTDFSEGLAAVGKAGQSFYIDRNGNVALSPPFMGLGTFRSGLATFRQNDKTGVLDKTGKVVLDAQFTSIEILSDGVIMAEDQKKGIGYADRTGRFFWQPTY